MLPEDNSPTLNLPGQDLKVPEASSTVKIAPRPEDLLNNPKNPLFEKLKQNNFLILVIGGAVALLMAVFAAIYLISTSPNPTPNTQNTLETPDKTSSSQNPEAVSYYPTALSPSLNNPPKTEFSYTINASKPKLIDKADILNLNTNITQAQAMQIAQKFSINVQPNLIGISNFHFFDDLKRLSLTVYQPSGAFTLNDLSSSLSSPGEDKLVTITSDTQAVTTATNYLKSLKLWEDDLIASMGNPYPKNPVVYKRKSRPEAYYVEFHRGWRVLPILTEIGLLNSALKDQEDNPKKFLRKDNDIIYSSDSLIGFGRPDQFNTVTVGVKNTGEVFYLKYYLRQITSKKSIALKPYEKALEELQSGKSKIVLVYPVAARAGENVSSDYTSEQWQQLFPENKAVSDEAVVDDIQLAYQENLITEPQPQLLPTYIFRGRAPLKTGIVVNFVALVDAIPQEEKPK